MVTFKTQQIDFGTLFTTSEVEKTEDGSIFVSIQALDGVISTLVDAICRNKTH